MKKLKNHLKRIQILFIAILLACSCFFVVGCEAENDGFRYISSITFITNGEYVTKKSTYVEDYMSNK